MNKDYLPAIIELNYEIWIIYIMYACLLSNMNTIIYIIDTIDTII